jgi:hypothetical protein
MKERGVLSYLGLRLRLRYLAREGDGRKPMRAEPRYRLLHAAEPPVMAGRDVWSFLNTYE